MASKQKGLGRGLDALIKDESNNIEESRIDDKSGVEEVEISKVSKSPWQPRSNFDADLLNNLTQSVKVHGVLQPLIVREIDGNFELIAGERRLRAAEAAGLKTIPVIITTASDEKALQLALIENLQREDLNPIEEAEGYALLQKQFGLTQEKVAEQVGKARTSVANSLRILDLSDIIRKHLADGLLSIGHAKVLLTLDSSLEQEKLATRIIKESITVRALERLVKKLSLPIKKPRAEKSGLIASLVMISENKNPTLFQK